MPPRGIAADIPELRLFMRDLNKFSPGTAKATRKRFRASAGKVARDARGRVKVRTGKLKRSITPRVTTAGVASVVATAPHARINEFGGRHRVFGRDEWVKQEAHPALIPARDAHLQDFLHEADRAVRDGAREAGFK